MANLTITVDAELLKRARMRALEQGTSVNALLRDYLEVYAGSDRAQRALRSFVAAASRSRASSGPAGRAWRREDLYDR